MAQIIRKGMDHYWRVVYAPSDEGFDAIEIGWRRQHEADMKWLNEKFGKQFEEIFGK
jgi:hypothetical protein